MKLVGQVCSEHTLYKGYGISLGVDLLIVTRLDGISPLRIFRVHAILKGDCKGNFFVTAQNILKAIVRILSTFKLGQHLKKHLILLLE